MKALYVRTSTSDQDGEAQLHQLERAAEQRWPGEAREVRFDIGHSGAKASRPALDEIRRQAVAGQIDTLMVVALDRLGRSLPDLVLLLEQLAAAGCLVISLREQLDMTTPAGRLMLHVIGAMAEFERGILRERVMSGLARARERGTRSGKAIGRPIREINFKAVEKMRKAGASWRRIAQHFRIPRRTLVRSYALHHGWVVEQNHPPKKRPRAPRKNQG